MVRNEDKENEVMVSMDDEGNFPQTPAHLLKRTRSTVLKPPQLLEKPDLSNIKGEVPSRNTSPLRILCAQQGRLPLASKDNNRPNCNIHQQQSQELQSQAPTPSLKEISLQFKKKKQPLLDKQYRSEHGHVLANPRKLQKYGSVLGCNTLPKMKSLVLKDVDGGDKIYDDAEDEDEDYILRLKLQKAINQPKEKIRRDDGGVGGLFQKNGLEQLIRESSRDNEDKGIEFGPGKHDPLPYIPNGYTPPDDADIEKLKTFHSPFPLSEETDLEDSGSDQGSGLLRLEEFSGEEVEDDTIDIFDRGSFKAKKHNTTPILEIEPHYRGDGLSPDELNGLLSD